ncbi:MAG: RNA methyltransferase [Campylobacterota bacterium]|nr:RNA methyltransferase [Campylobacterota bacterium]
MGLKIKIDDIKIDELEIYHKIRDNAFSEDNSFIADSPKVVNMLLESDIEVKSILATPEYYDQFSQLIESKNISKLYVATKDEMKNIVGHKIHHNCMMHGIRPAQTALENLGSSIIMLDEITSTENIGSIARSAAALGVDSYLLPTQGPHPYGRRALRVSMGYISKLKTHLYNDIFSTIKTLQKSGYKVYAAEVTKDSTPLIDVKVTEKWVLLMGHEGKGISKEILDVCDEVVSIEMQAGIKSFNVGVAASIMMYQFKNSK